MKEEDKRNWTVLVKAITVPQHLKIYIYIHVVDPSSNDQMEFSLVDQFSGINTDRPIFRVIRLLKIISASVWFYAPSVNYFEFGF